MRIVLHHNDDSWESIDCKGITFVKGLLAVSCDDSVRVFDLNDVPSFSIVSSVFDSVNW